MKCKDCKWWDEFGLVDGKDATRIEGFCRRYAPRIVEGQLFEAIEVKGEFQERIQRFPACWDNLEAVWPKTLDSKWCGEFKDKA